MLDAYNWEDHARSVLHRYDSKAATCIDRQSEFAFEMTNGHYGKESVKTIELRNSIVKYLMNIHGIVDKYFSYDKINKVLHRD